MRPYLQNSLTVRALRVLSAYKTHIDMYKFLQKSQYWSRDQLEEYQLQQLSKLLSHAYQNVPYYKKVFDERGLKPKDIQDFGDLQKLPLLTKEIIQNNFNDLKARNYPENKFEYVTTGGSTGIPLGFYYEKNVSRAIEMAFMRTLWERVGYRLQDKCAVLRGNVVKSADKGKFWETAMFTRWLILSSYHMTDNTLPKYIKKIKEFKPKFIQAYPSTINILAKFMQENNIKPFPTVKALLLGSENLYSWQRELLEEVFKCRGFSWYGNSEQTVLAGECEVSSYYHIFPEYGIVELIGSDGKPVKREGKLGEVISTGLNNFVFPLIRYRTMDLATFANKKCECGRDYPLLEKVEGRLQEFIVTGTGRLISMTAINMHSDVFDNVKQFQFYQEKKGEVIFNIVRKPPYNDKDTEYIRSELYKKLGRDVNLIIRFVDDIPRTRSGKYRFLIQRLPIEFGDLEE